MSGRPMPDVCVSASRLSEFLHATLHAVGGANGQIHRIAGLLEGQCGNLDEAGPVVARAPDHRNPTP